MALSLLLSSALLGLSNVTLAQESKAPAPDNSAVNVRDRAPDALTSDQQSNTKSDVTLASDIRRAVVNDKSLSVIAHNVKIISENGKVTLRGPVNTQEEKAAIGSAAQTVAGAGNVDNQLEVKSQ